MPGFDRRIITFQIEKILHGKSQQDGRVVFARRDGTHARSLPLHKLQALSLFGRRSSFCGQHVFGLGDADVFNVTRVGGEEDGACKLPVLPCDTRNRVPSQAMPQHENLFWIHFGLLAQHCDRANSIVDGFFFECVREHGHLRPIDFSAFVVTQHLDAARGEACRKVGKNAGRKNRLVAIVRARTVNQQDGGMRPFAREP